MEISAIEASTVFSLNRQRWLKIREAIANRSRVIIRVTNILARAGGVIDQVNIFLSFNLITVHNLIGYWRRRADVKGVTSLPCSGVLVVRERMRSSE